VARAESGWLAAPRVAASCPTSVDASRLAGADAIFADDGTMASFGERATASPAHRRFVNWIAGRLAKLPGAQVDSIPYGVNRWTPKRIVLRGRDGGGHAERIAVSGPLPYAKPTDRGGVAGRLVYIPADKTLADVDVRGKVVVRDAVTTKVPNAAITALEWWSYDPALTLTRTIGDTYERENAGQARVDDLQAAGAHGAAAVIFVHGLPADQVRDQYAPYEGVQWPVPSVMVGVDEGQRIKDLAAHDGTARVVLQAEVKPVKTRMLIATLPGLSDEKIVVQSHTDGMNALWDNGPIAMLAMADYFAALGKECRPRTLQFVFTTGHLYQHLVAPDRDGSAEQFAKAIDKEYDQGKVAFVLPIEHLGAKGFKAVARGGGKPGRELVPTGGTEPSSLFIGDSPSLISTALQVVAKHDLRETIALRGLDLPGLSLAPNDNFGGEGNPYQHHLIPTLAMVTAPWTLFDPAFSLEQLIDKSLLHRHTVVFTDMVHAFSTVPRELLGGGYVAYREVRRLTCGTGLEALGLVRHCYGP
jgi:hypothetical protein